MKPTRLSTVTIAIALMVTACGGTSDAELPLDTGAAATCLAGDPNCQDLGQQPSGEEPLFTDDEPTDGQGNSDVQPLIGGGVSVGDAIATHIDGGFAIVGFYYDDGSGAVLCELLAESLPPQCGGASIPVDNSAGVELDELETQGTVTWTNQTTVLVGEMIDGVFVVTPIGG